MAASQAKASGGTQQSQKNQATTPTIDTSAYSEQRHVQRSSLTTITESRQTDGSSPMRSHQHLKVDQAQVEEANNFINEYVRRGNSKSKQASADRRHDIKMVNTAARAPVQLTVHKSIDEPVTQ